MDINQAMKNLVIGDHVYFEKPNINNYDLYWIVVEKNKDSLLLEINEMGANDSKLIETSFIKYVIKKGFKK